jgi:hypothetical protein
MLLNSADMLGQKGMFRAKFSNGFHHVQFFDDEIIVTLVYFSFSEI